MTSSSPPSGELDSSAMLARLKDELRVNIAELVDLEKQRERMIAASLDSNADDEHDPEGATIAFEREQLTASIERAQVRHHDIVAALKRVDDGTYGVCQRCGSPIAPGRLEARPQVRTCIACAAS